MKKRLVIVLVLCSLGFFIFLESLADTSVTFSPVSGMDTTNGAELALTTTASGDIFKLSLSDNKRMASNLAWPSSGSYDETKYIEFVFGPDIPSDAVVSSVTVIHEFRRATILAGAKLEVWDGNIWNDVSLILPDAISTDLSETKDIFSIINTPIRVNGIKIRFLAYRNTYASSATTSHDFLQLAVNYTPSATLTPSPIPTQIETPTPIFIEIPSPTPETTPSVTSTPSPIVISSGGSTTSYITPTPTPNTTPSTSSGPSASPTATPIVSIISTPYLLPTATPIETLTPTPTIVTNNLVAVITTPRVIVRKITPTPITPIPSIILSKPSQSKIVLGLMIIKNKILDIWRWLNRPKKLYLDLK